MRCCDVEKLWDEVRQGLERLRPEIVTHLRRCPPCEQAYRDFEGVAHCLAHLPPAEPPMSLVPTILRHIAEIRARERHAADTLAAILSPLGRLHVAFRETGITYIGLDRGESRDQIRNTVARRLRRPVRFGDAPAWVCEAVEHFFKTGRPDYQRTDISDLTPFEQAALRKAAEIPPGEVRSYGWIAGEIGRPKAARAVGRVMATNPIPFLFPCHRVVDSSGALHNYAYGLELKARLLTMEGYPKR